MALSMRITGKVQGVFFRASTKSQALSHGISGWVQNNPDGSVEIHAEGKQDALHDLHDWCEEGPPGAKVENVQTVVVPDEGCTTFEIRHV